MGACVSGYFLRLFYPSSSFLASLSPLPIEVHRSLSSSSSLSFSSSFFSSFFPFFSSSFQVSLLEWLRWLVQALCSIYAFTRHAFLGVCTAGISMILNPGGGDHEYQERLIQSDLFKNLFGPVSFANSLLFPSSSASSSFSSSSFSSSSSSPDYLTELVNSFRNETESEKGRLLMSSLLVGEEEEIKKRIRELFFLQGREVEEGDFLLLLWSSRMIDMSLLEFFFGILNYMSIALASILQLAGETYHFKVHHVFLSTLNACCFFYFFGIPFCRPFGGPMLNAGYAALVTSYRLDLIGFLIFVSVDLFSAYISARYLVRPSFLSSSSYPSFSAVERERRRKERKEEKETGDLQDDRDDGDVCEEKERRGLFSRFFLGKKRQKVEDEKNKKKRSLKKTE